MILYLACMRKYSNGHRNVLKLKTCIRIYEIIVYYTVIHKKEEN